MPEVIVIGAGIGGLAAALRLHQRGVDTLLLEAGERPGGVIRSSTRDGFLREHAANGFLSGAADGAFDLCRELSVELVPAAAAARRRWIYVDEALRAVPATPMEAITTELISWRAKLELLAEPLRPVRGGEPTVDEWARHRLGEEVARKLVAPFVTGIFGGDSAELSLPAAFPRLAALEERGGLVRGMLARHLELLKDGGSSPSRRGRSRLHAPAGGLEALVNAIADSLGDSVRLSTPVVAIESGSPTRVHLASGESLAARVVVLATPAHAGARLVSDSAPSLAAILDRIPYAPIAVVHLGYRRADIPHPPNGENWGFGFLVATNEPVRMLGTVFESVLWPDRAPDDCMLLRCIYGGARDPRAVSLSEEELLGQARRDLDRVLAVRHKPTHVHITRWTRAIAQYNLGHLDRVDRASELARQMRVVLAGSSYHGPAVNSCIADARRVANEVMALA